MGIFKPAPTRRASRTDRRSRPAAESRTRPVEEHTIAFDAVSYTYPGAPTPALDGVSLHVRPGEFVYLVGASGSGKSTLLRLLYAEAKPAAGRLRVAGTNLRRLRSAKVAGYRRKLGVVFQDFKLLEGRTVYEQVEFALTVTGRRKQAGDLVPKVLDLVGLVGKEDRLPTELSGGEQQRVAIARALVTAPDVLIADEPTGNLDPVTSETITEVLARVNAAGTTVVMATHDKHLVDATGHRVVVMAEGRVVRDDADGGYWAGLDPDPAPHPAAAAGDESDNVEGEI